MTEEETIKNLQQEIDYLRNNVNVALDAFNYIIMLLKKPHIQQNDIDTMAIALIRLTEKLKEVPNP